ncbi:hypothetical protein DMN91_008613 [Ooceraea biroi]|uniref:alpha-amylase n=1 Tax=Ooceraea biroi TaxID=2015173 RepID=A0A3L8DCM7_OOCBI|nr:hypothetical protein DMN91_008613 [Ooceraea biroi]
MVSRCNKVGVRIYVDVVVNHMTADVQPAYGTGGASAKPRDFSYPAIPYSSQDFHVPPCAIQNYNNATEVRNCELSGLHDLDQSKEHVRNKIVEFLNNVIDLGVAGFRLNDNEFFEVIDIGGEAVNKYEYNGIANVIEFQYGIVLGSMFRGQDQLTRLQNFNDSNVWRLLPSDDALTMIDNHDNQRGHGAGGSTILTYKDPKPYKIAVAFMLAFPYGHPRVMSSYAFSDPSQGPSASSDGSIISPEISNCQCTNGWICEHR